MNPPDRTVSLKYDVIPRCSHRRGRADARARFDQNEQNEQNEQNGRTRECDAPCGRQARGLAYMRLCGWGLVESGLVEYPSAREGASVAH